MLSDSTYIDYLAIPKENRTISSHALSCLLDWRIMKPFRIIGAIRYDNYNIGHDILSYEIGSTFRLNKANLFRFVHTVSSMSPFMVYSYLSNNMGLVVYGDDAESNVIRTFLGNESLDYLTNKTYEMGWRYKQRNLFNLDLEVFYSQLNNFTELQKIEDVQTTYYLERRMQFLNVNDLTANQLGVSLDLSYRVSQDLDLSFFYTLQETKYEKGDDYYGVSFSSTENSTPSFWGGMTSNLKITPKLALFTLVNFMGEQYYKYESINGEFKKMKIDDFLTMDFKLSYKASSVFSVYLKGDNILGKHKEYGFADSLEPWQISVGMHYRLSGKE